jgi:hypothetical protein
MFRRPALDERPLSLDESSLTLLGAAMPPTSKRRGQLDTPGHGGSVLAPGCGGGSGGRRRRW